MKKLSIRTYFVVFYCLLLFAPISNFAQTQTGKDLLEEAKSNYKKREFKQVLLPAFAADSIFTAQGNNLGAMETKILIAKTFVILKRPEEVVKYSEQAIPLLALTGKQDSLIEADMMNTYASGLMDVRRFDASEVAYQRAIKIKRQVFGPTTVEAGIHISNLANLYFAKGEIDKAMQYAKEGIQIREGGISPNPNLITAYTNLGIIHKRMDLYQQAIFYFGKVAQLLESDPERFKDKAAALYQSYASLYQDLGDFDKSKQYNELALLKLDTNSVSAADIYYNLALLAGDLKDEEDRVNYAKKALIIMQSQQEKDLAREANCFEQICISFLNTNPDSTLYFAGLANALLTTADADFGLEQASNLSYIALAKGKKGFYHEADSLMSIAIIKVRNIFGDKHLLTGNYETMHANIFFEAKDYDKALQKYNSSLAAYNYTQGCIWDTIVHVDQLLENLGKKNQTLIELHRKSPSLAYKNAIENGWAEILDLLNYLRRTHQGSKTKLLFSSQFTAIAGDAIRWYASQNDNKSNEKALVFAEKARSLSLLEAFLNANAQNTLLSDSLRSMADAFAAERKLWSKQYEGSKNDTDRSNSYLKLMETEQKQKQWLQNLESKDSSFYQVKYNNTVVTTTEIRAMLKPKQALVAYFVDKKNIYVFVVLSDSLILKEIPLEVPLEELVAQFRLGLLGNNMSPKSDKEEIKLLDQYLEYGTILYKSLLFPIEKTLKDQVALIIVPDGVLCNLPFDALLTSMPMNKGAFRDYPYLFKQFRVSYAYSATLHKAMCDKKHKNIPQKKCVAFAPFASKNASGNIESIAGFAPIVYSSKEVLTVQKKMGGDILWSKDASKITFNQIADQYKIIHFATHGVSNNRSGDYSYLVLRSTRDSKDQFLYAKDIYNSTLNADLVVLSACETGIGKFEIGEGNFSIARAFAYAGVKSVVCTLWSVNGGQTTEYITHFYEGLSIGLDTEDALLFAKKKYFENATTYHCHPYFWAAFVGIGDMRRLK
jgi:CHAT domain-containing protein